MKTRRTILHKVPPFLGAFLLLILSVASVHAQRPSSAWGTIPSPNAGFGPNELFDVDVLSDNDIWAVGNFGDFVAPEPQVQHWDGSSWRLVALPEGFIGDLLGVSAVAANDVWFVGGAASPGETFIFHWDGTSISRVTSPNPGLYNRLYDVVALAPNDVWAVGEYASGGVSKTLIEHWDGTKWSVVASPTSQNEYTQLLGVAAIAPNDIWAVGEAGSNTYLGRNQLGGREHAEDFLVQLRGGFGQLGRSGMGRRQKSERDSDGAVDGPGLGSRGQPFAGRFQQ